MKKTLTVISLLAGAASVYSQGTVSMTDYGSTLLYHVYNVQSTAPTGGDIVLQDSSHGVNSYSGAATTDKGPVGNGVYNAGSALSGSGYSGQLLAAPNTGDALSALVATGSVFSFAANGTLSATSKIITIPSPALPGTSAQGGTGATVALAAWNNEGGTITSLMAAQQAGDPWGISALVNISALGGASVPPTNPPLLTGINSFSLGSVPEPSTIALGVMGASTLLFRRRK